MAQIIREITVDVAQTNNLRAITAKQNDLNSRFLKINITNEGEPIKVEPTRTITMNVKRTDNTVRMFYGSVNDDGSVIVPLTAWMLELEGSINCDVSIISEKDLQKLTTMQFSIYVEPAVYPQSDLEESEEYDVLVQLLDAAEDAQACVEATEKAEEATKRANDAADGVVITEQNTKAPLIFWVGTREEYDAIVAKEPNCFYIISDDPSEEEIYKKINDVHNALVLSHTVNDITAAVIPENESDEYYLQKCGKVIELSYVIKRSWSQGYHSLMGTIATIQGYAPKNPIYTYLISNFPVTTGIDEMSSADHMAPIPIVIEPDETGKNTIISVFTGKGKVIGYSIGTSAIENGTVGFFSTTFVCQ